MFAFVLILAAMVFSDSKALSVQIALDHAGYSCNAIDGQWGGKSQRALACYCLDRHLTLPESPEAAYDQIFANEAEHFRLETLTQADLDALVTLPKKAEEKSRLAAMGYETLPEMFAERGHTTVALFKRLNPGIDWAHAQPGLQVVLPDFPSIATELAAGDRGKTRRPKRPTAALVRVSLSRCEIDAFDSAGKRLAHFPCSVARDKAKLPPQGELKVTSYIANPNYTYTPDYTPKGQKPTRYIFPPGPNCPVGVAWLGLNLPGYGLHGTPSPETIGRAESHGCFRLANWNAARLYAICTSGTRVIVER